MHQFQQVIYGGVSQAVPGGRAFHNTGTHNVSILYANIHIYIYNMQSNSCESQMIFNALSGSFGQTSIGGN